MKHFGFRFDFEKTVFFAVKNNGIFDRVVVTEQAGIGLSQVGVNNGGVIAVDDGGCLIEVIVLEKGFKKVGMMDKGTGG